MYFGTLMMKLEFEKLEKAIKGHDAATVRKMMAEQSVRDNQLVREGAFIEACRCGSVEIAEILLTCGAPLCFNESSNHEGMPAICFAVYARNEKVLQLLLEEPCIDVNATSNAGISILYTCIRYVEEPLRLVKIILASDRFTNPQPTKKFIRAKNGKMCPETSKLMDSYQKDPNSVRKALREELGYLPRDAGELFAIVVLLCDGYLELKE